jgi:hypothetical protein
VTAETDCDDRSVVDSVKSAASRFVTTGTACSGVTVRCSGDFFGVGDSESGGGGGAAATTRFTLLSLFGCDRCPLLLLLLSELLGSAQRRVHCDSRVLLLVMLLQEETKAALLDILVVAGRMNGRIRQDRLADAEAVAKQAHLPHSPTTAAATMLILMAGKGCAKWLEGGDGCRTGNGRWPDDDS